MKIKELIEQLKQYDQDLESYLFDDEIQSFCKITQSEKITIKGKTFIVFDASTDVIKL